MPHFWFSFFSSVPFNFFLLSSVKTDLMENGANSTLFIAKVRKTDTGNYTCSIGPNDFHTINVQVLNGNFVTINYFVSTFLPPFLCQLQEFFCFYSLSNCFFLFQSIFCVSYYIFFNIDFVAIFLCKHFFLI